MSSAEEEEEEEMERRKKEVRRKNIKSLSSHKRERRVIKLRAMKMNN